MKKVKIANFNPQKFIIKGKVLSESYLSSHSVPMQESSFLTQNKKYHLNVYFTLSILLT